MSSGKNGFSACTPGTPGSLPAGEAGNPADGNAPGWREGICVENVSFSYGDEPVIENAHFHIQEGSFVSFIGPNGGGKSTLVKLILGLLEPDRGFISIFGGTPREQRSLLGYVPQFSHFDPDFPINIRDVVLMGRLRKGLHFLNREDREAVERALALVGLEGFGSRSYSRLSGGQRQRVLIARALATEPRVLVLDEPTSSVDLEAETQLYRLLMELNRKVTVILVSHDLDFVAEQVNKVICIDRKVVIHPTGKLDSASYRSLFGRELRIVRHNTRLEETHE